MNANQAMQLNKFDVSILIDTMEETETRRGSGNNKWSISMCSMNNDENVAKITNKYQKMSFPLAENSC